MPGAVAPHPQCNEQMFQALKKHILKERQKKKEEQEADAENERQRKERELQEKQDVMTLSENREQITQLEQKLAQLKDEKHQLFLQLKKVLNEDENRRRQINREQESRVNAEVTELYNVSAPSHSHLLMQQEYPSSSYKVQPVQGSMKRPRSPSPPHLYQTYNPKTTRLPYQKSFTGYYPNPGSSQAYYPGPPYTTLPIRTDAQPQPMKQHYSNQPYMHAGEHTKLYAEDKYYSVASRPATHVALHGGAIPIQPPQSKTGGITSGYPIRQPTSAPPPQHVTPGISTTHSSPGYHYPMVSQYPPSRQQTLAPTQHLGPRSHAVYPSQSPTTGRLVYSQANVPQSRYM
ncbi:unnamed protein product [Nezara viridula]|uniref:G protein pathway suppressor 2 n=1 Tax=Nezara viridula TaxID=85310 RepID=A0A9P0EIY7_NEZVI|nr:unnamed protein product [Nezara viridula]